MTLEKLKLDLQKAGNKTQAEILQRFFKTGKGQYGEGDIFLGIKVPEVRKIAKKYDLDLEDIQKLLDSGIHDERFTGLVILMNKYKKSNEEKKQSIFEFYLKNAERVNNWDLVDLSAPKIVGDFLSDKPKDILYELARSENIWKKRIAIISTFAFIRLEEFQDTLKISEILLRDKHDLMHKAVGWMLREVGKKDEKVLEYFLRKHYKKMPRTMLRYAIEKFEEEKRKKYLKGNLVFI